MKTLLTSATALSLLLLVSASAYAEGSKITNSTIDNASRNVRATTTARDGGEASTGSVIVKDKSVVTNSTIRNSSNNEGASTTATGTGGGVFGIGSSGSEAHTGSVVVKD